MKILTNSPDLWLHDYPIYKKQSNKYNFGHLVVVGGDEFVGAAKLAALSGLRIGAGLSTIACSNISWLAYAADAMSVMAKPIESILAFNDFIKDTRKNSLLIGPGAGVGVYTKKFVKIALDNMKPTVLDADALISFKEDPKQLFDLIHCDVVLTPHEGEFKALFGNISGMREDRALKAAKLSGAIIVLKGNETIIATPDGKIIKNTIAPSYLATAGTGDVLSGMISGLIARGMSAFFASAMAVWVHSKVAEKIGIGMISQDMPNYIGQVLGEILDK